MRVPRSTTGTFLFPAFSVEPLESRDTVAILNQEFLTVAVPETSRSCCNVHAAPGSALLIHHSWIQPRSRNHLKRRDMSGVPLSGSAGFGAYAPCGAARLAVATRQTRCAGTNQQAPHRSSPAGQGAYTVSTQARARWCRSSR
jgi:hypothetical protein